MPDYKPFPDARSWISGEFSWPGKGEEGPNVFRAVIKEGLSKLTETSVLIRSWSEDADISGVVGRNMRVHVKTEDESERIFSGLCMSMEKLGYYQGNWYYLADLRPWFWLLTRSQNCRIYQEMSVPDIISDLLSTHGLTDFENKLTGTYDVRTYCVQYRETDYAFLCRLMEEEGIYFYFSNDLDSTAVEKLVLCDSISAHSEVPGHATIDYHARQMERGAEKAREDHIAEWTEIERVTSGKVTLNDFDFKLQNADLKFEHAIESGSHSHKNHEIYDYHGHHSYPGVFGDDKKIGEKYATVRMEAETVPFNTFRAAANVRALAAGQTFAMDKHPDKAANSNYLIVSAEHYVQDQNFLSAEEDKEAREARKMRGDMKRTGVEQFLFDHLTQPDREQRRDLSMLDPAFPKTMEKDAFASTFRSIPKTTQYRAPIKTPWPKISGPHTATVVGKSGEEIWTDEWGRIKVQFHWDRLGEKNEMSSCWVRVMTPWSGTGWGMVALPRMGQEAVIEFEEGDPDRPICTGMMYNDWQKPAYTYPDNPTELGIRTRSSKQGSDKEYNELMFDDLKGSEKMRVQAQKDHQMLIKNKSVVAIGLEEHEQVDGEGKIKSDVEDGSLSEIIKQHVTRVVQEGDHSLTIEKGDEEYLIKTGSQNIEIKTDKTQKIEGKHTKTITGNDAKTVKTGNMTVDVKSGKITMTAAQKIELKVGGSSIVIDPVSVTIKATMLKFEGTAMAELKSKLTTVKGDGMLTAKGGITMIN
ncbi:MAG: type VI secretion system tip protein TssI/VgrG [Sedimentitalea sp.]|uniref:type VI secretion system Vgr family protein n=1 Tax=Sedimentitalea sp. TaxID=2048915 RepID=UPI003266F2B3